MLENVQVKKYGDKSKIDIIAAEVGGNFINFNSRSQMQLLDELVKGCEEAFEKSGYDGKVNFCTRVYFSFLIIALLSLILRIKTGRDPGFLWCIREGTRNT